MKITLRPAFISFLVMVLLFSCKEKLNELAPVTQSTPITVAEAQQYYNTLQQKLKLQEAAGKPTKRTQKKVRKADWQQAKTLKRNKLEWVELPVIFDEDLNNRGLTARKMFFFKDKKNKIYTYIYEWVMDSDFYKKNNVLANNYSGALMIYDEEGNLLGGNMYKNGKFISNVVLMIDSEMIMPVKDKAKAGRTTFALPEGYDVFMYDAYSYSGNVSTTQYYPSLNELNSVIEACGNVNVIMMHSRPGIKVDEYYPLPWVLPFVAGGESGDNGGSHHPVTTETSANDETLVWVPAPTTVDLAESFISLYSNYFTDQEKNWILKNNLKIVSITEMIVTYIGIYNLHDENYLKNLDILKDLYRLEPSEKAFLAERNVLSIEIIYNAYLATNSVENKYNSICAGSHPWSRGNAVKHAAFTYLNAKTFESQGFPLIDGLNFGEIHENIVPTTIPLYAPQREMDLKNNLVGFTLTSRIPVITGVSQLVDVIVAEKSNDLRFIIGNQIFFRKSIWKDR